MKRALAAGFNEEEAKSYKNADDLRKTLDIIGNIASEDSDQQPQQKSTEDKTSVKPFEPRGFKLEFDNKDDIAPEITAAIEKLNQHYTDQLQQMNAHYAGQLAQFQQTTGELQSAIANNGALEFESRFERMVADLGAEYEHLVGKGTGRQLDARSEPMANRNKVIRAMSVIKQMNAGDNQSPPLEEVFKQAVATVFSGQNQKIANKKLAATVQSRSKQNINKPTDRTPKKDKQRL